MVKVAERIRSRRDADRAELIKQIKAWRKKGLTLEAIAAQMGFKSKQAVHHYLKSAKSKTKI